MRTAALTVLAAVAATVSCGGERAAPPTYAGAQPIPLDEKGASALTVVHVAAGRAHACALLLDRTVRCWGNGLQGQLGIGAFPVTMSEALLRIGSIPTPTKVSGLEDVVQIACGGDHSCALRADGTVACWGSNAHGELGDGSMTSRVAPVHVNGLDSVTELSLGERHSCARLVNGTVRCFGSNTFGQLGDGTTLDHALPVEVPALLATRIALGQAHTCAIELSGTVRCWGNNGDGQLGDGTTKARSLPTKIADLGEVTQLALGDHHSCARLSDATMRCWGCGEWGQLGDGTTSSHPRPQAVVGLTGAIDLAARDEVTIASRHDGSVVMWGLMPYAQLKDHFGRNVIKDYVTVPSPMAEFANVVEVTLGKTFGCARNVAGKLRCWGTNELGQQGDGTFVTAQP